MLLTDYFYSKPDPTWGMALQCGVTHGTIRLPEDAQFDVTSLSQLKAETDRFRAHGITPSRCRMRSTTISSSATVSATSASKNSSP